MLDLGSIGRFLAALGGLWTRSEQYLSLIMAIALPLAALVFTFSMLQSFFQDGPEEDYFRIMARFGITLAILGDYRDLFTKFNLMSSDLAHWFADPNSFQNFFQQVQSQFTSLSGVLAFATSWASSIVAMLILLSAVILVIAYIALVAGQAIAVILLYVFGPLLIALLPSRQLSSVTYGYVRALLQVLLWPAVWSIMFALFFNGVFACDVQGFEPHHPCQKSLVVSLRPQHCAVCCGGEFRGTTGTGRRRTRLDVICI